MQDMTVFDPSFIEDYLPALYVDFDSLTYYAHNENMDYLKCPDELNWQNQTSCK